MISTLQVVICFVEVFLLDLDLRNFVQSRASQVIIIVSTNDLLEIQYSITEIVQLFEGLGLVEVCLAKGGWRLFCPFSNLCEFVEILQGLLRHLHLEEEKAALHETLTDSLRIDFDGF